MNATLRNVVTAPLPKENLDRLNAVVADYDREQLIWSSGYLAGLASASVAAAAALPAADTQAAAHTARGVAEDQWTVFYATETGNSRRLAEAIHERARASGVATKLQNLASVRPRALTKLRRALFVVATHGIGEPPDGTEAFFEYWLGKKAPRLEQLEYSVLALGDSSYADFCETGRRLDRKLDSLGATRVAERTDCDLDFHAPADRWMETVLEKARQLSAAAAPNRAVLRAVKTPATRRTAFDSPVLTNQPITGRRSSKDVRHIELDLAESGLTYEPGDSLAVVAQNPPQIVDAVLAAAKLDGDSHVRVDGEKMPLAQALAEHREITALSWPLLEKVSAQHESLAGLLADAERRREYFQSHQVMDVLIDYPTDWNAETLVDTLRKLPPRLYSIASSPDANPDEAHLTVAVVNYEKYGRQHWGSASTFIAEDPRTVPVYVEPNEQFRLPADTDAPVIMIGAGTGIAPYRAFVEHRREHGHRGDNWLIFGDRNFSSDFLYQLEWLRYRKEGVLQRIDVAFSRDGKEKVYVQHRIAEQGPRFMQWLERGAHVYVCGDAGHMAAGVNDAILGVLRKEGGLSDERSLETLGELRAAGRYQRDVY